MSRNLELEAAPERRFIGRALREPDTSWQRTAWDYYSTTPEVRFAANWIGAAMSRATLYAGRRAPDDTVEPASEGHPAAEEVAAGNRASRRRGDPGPGRTGLPRIRSSRP